MKRLNVIAATVAILGVAACAQMKDDEPAMAPVGTAAGPDDGYRDLHLVIEGERMETFVEDPDSLREVVEALVGTSKPEDIRTWLSIIESPDSKATEVPESLNGLSGLAAVQVLQYYLASMTSASFCEFEVKGRIDDYIYDLNLKAGHLAVDVRYEICGIPLIEYHWDIDVVRDFIVVPRDNTKPKDPFPGTLVPGTLDEWPPELLNRIFNGVPTANPPKPPLVNKLWAKGTGIVVRHVYQVFSPSSIVRLNQNHPFYTSTAESCIDMMWAGPVPAVKTDPFGPPVYCLGRCDHPMIVNTD